MSPFRRGERLTFMDTGNIRFLEQTVSPWCEQQVLFVPDTVCLTVQHATETKIRLVKFSKQLLLCLWFFVMPMVFCYVCGYFRPSCQKATALAAATLREST